VTIFTYGDTADIEERSAKYAGHQIKKPSDPFDLTEEIHSLLDSDAVLICTNDDTGEFLKDIALNTRIRVL